MNFSNTFGAIQPFKIQINKTNNKYSSLIVSGHSNYDEHGKDIVCAAASSIATTTVNGVLAFDKESLSYEVSEKGLIIKVNDTHDITQTLISTWLIF